MTTMDAPTSDVATEGPNRASGKPYQLGILFVHGMGQQERGDTITQMGDALGEWLRKRLANGEAAGTDFSIREAELRGSQSAATSSGSVSGRAHASVLITGRDKNAKRREQWLLAESWWADAFRPATLSELVAWAIAVGPWLIASQAAGLRRRLRLAYGNEPRWVGVKLRDEVISFMVTILAALVAAIITPLSLVLLLASLIPIPVVSGAIRGLAQNLSGSFGDLLVLVRSPIRFAAMAERVRSDIEWVFERADYVMVAAHSQGSAVSWHAIRRIAEMKPDKRPRIDLFLTFGQAFRKLKSLHRIHAKVPGYEQFWFAVLATLSTLLLLVVGMQLSTAIGVFVIERDGSVMQSLPSITPNLVNAAGFLVVLAVIQVILGREAEKNDDESETDIIADLDDVKDVFDKFRWIDLWASADPAPNGPLFRQDVAGVKSLRVRNLASTVLDHSVYWSNATEFVSAVAHAAASVVEWSPLGREALPARVRVASLVRERRVSMLALGRVAIVAGLLGALWALRGLLPELGNEVLKFVQSVPFVPAELFAKWHSIWKGVVAAVLLIVIAAISWWFMLGAWSAVIRKDEGDFFGEGDQPAATLMSRLWAVAAFLIPTLVIIGLGVFVGRWQGLLVYVPLGLVGFLVVVVLLRGKEPRLSDP